MPLLKYETLYMHQCPQVNNKCCFIGKFSFVFGLIIAVPAKKNPSAGKTVTLLYCQFNPFVWPSSHPRRAVTGWKTPKKAVK
jgi:hypothetical protein